MPDPLGRDEYIHEQAFVCGPENEIMESRTGQLGSVASLSASALCLASLSFVSFAQVTQRVSLDSAGAQGNGNSDIGWISSDGRYVAFDSEATNLVPGDTNGYRDIFIRDRQTGATERVSLSYIGTQADNNCYVGQVSDDGRYVAFSSLATNLVPADTNGVYDVFVRDRQLGMTERVSVDPSGGQANGDSGENSISADGRYVAFSSDATNLVPGGTNGEPDIFVKDRQTGATELVSVSSGGVQPNWDCTYPAITPDGRYVTFASRASNLVIGDTNGYQDIFVRDRLLHTTERVSLDSGGAQANGDCFYPSISADGRYVAFLSAATNLVPGDGNGYQDVFVHDRLSGMTERVNVDSAGVEANGTAFHASISRDGRYVAFDSNATNLVPGDTNGSLDAFVRDLQSGTTERVSLTSGGAQGNADTYFSSISADGRYVTLFSNTSNLVPGDTNGWTDVFVRDRLGAPNFTSLCDPGVGGVLACPCSNQPGGSGRGCDNSSGTGGAVLAASGGTFVSSDSLMFTTSDEKPTATSIVLQGTTTLVSGTVYGQGVRCVGGTLKRLFVKHAIVGSITAPDFVAGDPNISSRSAALGDVIQPGQSRWYLVYYRDPTVLGGCPLSSTFNATQTGQVTWAP